MPRLQEPLFVDYKLGNTDANLKWIRDRPSHRFRHFTYPNGTEGRCYQFEGKNYYFNERQVIHGVHTMSCECDMCHAWDTWETKMDNNPVEMKADAQRYYKEVWDRWEEEGSMNIDSVSPLHWEEDTDSGLGSSDSDETLPDAENLDQDEALSQPPPGFYDSQVLPAPTTIINTSIRELAAAAEADKNNETTRELEPQEWGQKPSPAWNEDPVEKRLPHIYQLALHKPVDPRFQYAPQLRPIQPKPEPEPEQQPEQQPEPEPEQKPEQQPQSEPAQPPEGYQRPVRWAKVMTPENYGKKTVARQSVTPDDWQQFAVEVKKSANRYRREDKWNEITREFEALPDTKHAIIPNFPAYQKKDCKATDERRYQKAVRAVQIAKKCLVDKKQTYSGAYEEWVFVNTICTGGTKHRSPEHYCSHCSAWVAGLDLAEKKHREEGRR